MQTVTVDHYRLPSDSLEYSCLGTCLIPCESD